MNEKRITFFPQRSYLFQNRPLTPPQYIKQDEYSKDLGGQVSVDFFGLFKCKGNVEGEQLRVMRSSCHRLEDSITMTQGVH